jgi:hypothetical protein
MNHCIFGESAFVMTTFQVMIIDIIAIIDSRLKVTAQYSIFTIPCVIILEPPHLRLSFYLLFISKSNFLIRLWAFYTIIDQLNLLHWHQ